MPFSYYHSFVVLYCYRCQQLERQVERKTLEANLANQQANNLQQEMMLRVAELQTQLESSKEKERNLEIVS